jgi:arylsulfatase A-like enzyme
VLASLALLGFSGCGGSSGGAVSVPLVDHFRAEMIEGSPQSASAAPEAAWNFATAASDPTLGWKAGPGVSGLQVVDGRLTGRSTTDSPLIYAARPAMDPNDTLYSLDLRIRSSTGSNMSAGGALTKDLNLAQMFQPPLGAPMNSPIRAGEAFQNLSLQPSTPLPLRTAETIVIKPVDVAGATFEIESVRLVSQKERLASIPTGVNWSGLGDIFRETVVSRSPERFQMQVDVPPNAWLDLNVGTVDDEPVTFKIAIGSGGNEQVLLHRTVTTPHRWEPAPVDLSAHAGPATLVFSLDVPTERLIGYWGAPVIRQRNAVPPSQQPAAQALGGVEPPRGVILIMCDTLRKDHLNAYGYDRETAPHLARMASQGALFLDNVSQATWTKVSTPSIMTSLYPSSHRVLDFTDRLSPAATTLAEVYRQAGYATVAYSSVLFTGKFSNMHQGFEELHEATSVHDPGYPAKSARTYVDRASDWIERHQGTPFFMFLHVFDPHDPFEPRSPYDALWADPSKKAEHQKNLENVKKVIENPLLKQFGMPNRAELEKAGIDPGHFVDHDNNWYDGSIRGMDAEVARLLERLRTLGLEQHTQVAFISDHGEEFIEHGRMFHGQSVYGELTGVPLMLYRPGVIPAVKIPDTVRSIDLMPTLLDLSGLPAPEGLQGQSLVPLMAAARNQPEGGGSRAEAAKTAGWQARPAISEKAKTDSLAGPPPLGTESFAIVLDGWKLIHNRIPEQGAPEFELYNHTEDPLNKNNVAADHADIIERLKGELENWHKMVAEATLPESVSEEDLSPAELERLRSLGYIK